MVESRATCDVQVVIAERLKELERLDQIGVQEISGDNKG